MRSIAVSNNLLLIQGPEKWYINVWRDVIVKICCKKFSDVFMTLAAAFCALNAHGAQAPNPRSASSVVVAPGRSEGRDVRRSGGSISSQVSTVSRSATARPANTVSRAAVGRAANTGVGTSRSATGRQAVVTTASRPDMTSARAATSGASRSATSARSAVGSARSAISIANVSRAATARATAVFDDISKIGGGYAACREAYATCMDQFCAKANDTYRRCYCSAKFTEFRNMENAMDQAKILLQRFEDNNLNAVDKTAAEVNAMYTATVGEAAIKNDTSGAAAILAEIGDLLSGKTKAATPKQTSANSLGVLSLDLSGDIDDIWSGGGDMDSIFSDGRSSDLSTLEGQELFNSASSQCLKIITDSCENNAVLNMAKSSYGILITQDCNSYEKKIDKQKEAVQQTVRTAEKYLRDARLEEYRAHNSSDVNDCISKVKAAITSETACGADYKRCLDYTGAYIDQSTGDPIYSPRLFQLSNLITLGGTNTNDDVLKQNPQFDSFLESRKMFAATALDSCRDIAPTVWEEFKRSALIEIAQAQDAKIEEVKMSCVSTMKECYDTQSSALKSFDDTTAKTSGALSAYAAKQMCQDKVTACAALYGGNSGTQCKFGSDGKLSDPKTCGLTALLKFVDAVDDVRVAEGCSAAIDSYVKQLCTPTSGDMGFPWNCRTKEPGNADDNPSKAASDSIAANIKQFAVENCSDPTAQDQSYADLPMQTQTYVTKAINDIKEQLMFQMMETCEALDGYWLRDVTEYQGMDTPTKLTAFYASNKVPDGWGQCVQNTTMIRCLAYNTVDDAKGSTVYATYDRAKDECNFTEAWYQQQCALMGNGYYENGVCYVEP